MNALTYSDAKKIADLYLKEQDFDHELVFFEDETIEEDFGWIFFYNTKKFQETGDFRDSVAGNAPIIVDKKTGMLTETGTAEPIEFYIDNYKNSLAEE